GRGEELHTVIQELARVGDTFASQHDDLATAIDGLGRLGASLAADDGAAITKLTDDLAGATETLARQRDRFVDTLNQVNQLASVRDQGGRAPHQDQLNQIRSELDDVTGTLAANRQTVAALLHNLAVLSERAPHAADNVGAILIYGWITSLSLPDGSTV